MDIYDESGVVVARSAHPIECERQPEADKLESDIMFYAFRYALGRMTYAVSDVSQYLIDHWNEIDANHQRLIHQEISEALTNNTAGHECDKERWRAVLALPNRAQQNVVRLPDLETSGGITREVEAEKVWKAIEDAPDGHKQAAMIDALEAYAATRLAAAEADLAKAREVIAKIMPYLQRAQPEPTVHPDWYTPHDERAIADLQSARAYMEGK